MTFDALLRPGTPDDVLAAIRRLCSYHRAGLLGGEVMPEDANPGLDRASAENALYFTLPMALNYQRDSYRLWRSALATYLDADVSYVFQPALAVAVPLDELRSALRKHGLAAQPERHTLIWATLVRTLLDHYSADVRTLFADESYDLGAILRHVREVNQRRFPYLSGPKIANYWLYVMTQYTDLPLSNRAALSVAPDTHVIQATVRLGLVDPTLAQDQLRAQTAVAWQGLLAGTELAPVDVHTPLWLWSRRGFSPDP